MGKNAFHRVSQGQVESNGKISNILASLHCLASRGLETDNQSARTVIYSKNRRSNIDEVNCQGQEIILSMLTMLHLKAGPSEQRGL